MKPKARWLITVTLLAITVCSVCAQRAEAEERPSQPAVRQRLITLGDSITKGRRDGVEPEETFASRIQSLARARGLNDLEVVNLGIGGERTDQALLRLDTLLALRPTLVTVMYGTNDSYVDPGASDSRITPQAYRENLVAIVTQLRQAGVRPVLMTEPRWAANVKPNGVGEHPNVRLEVFVHACRDVAKSLHVPLVDHYAHWTHAEQQGQNLSDWTTDGCHPNPAGHRVLASQMWPLIQAELTGATRVSSDLPDRGPGPPELAYDIELQSVLEHDDGEFLWFHPRVAAVPADPNGSRAATIVLTLQKHLMTSDHYSGLYVMTTADQGRTWTAPVARPELDWVADGEVDIAVADVTLGWHAPTGQVLAVGAQVRYSRGGEQLEDVARAHQTAYATYDPVRDVWSRWQRLEMPPETQFDFARSACAQFVVEPDGRLLLPFYIGASAQVPFASTVVECELRGQQLVYVQHGNILALDVARGLYEPSLIRFGDRTFLTLRNDERGYVSVSGDGLQFAPPRPWQFDDGEDLGSYNTQQHWFQLTHAESQGLFLAYTRRGAQNDHIPRHRAPLFVAQVDPERLQVMRATERVAVPERGATLGNFGVYPVGAGEAWLTVGEGIWNDAARQQGARGALWLARITAREDLAAEGR